MGKAHLLLPLLLLIAGAGGPSDSPDQAGISQPGIPQPSIPDRSFDITRFGAVGDGKTMDTAAIQSAIAACEKAGGGSVVLPAGTFLTGKLSLASNLDFHLDRGCTLMFSDADDAYRDRRGLNDECMGADDCHDVAITGDGAIDGHGQRWWDAFRKVKGTADANLPENHRPYMVVFNGCSKVLVRDVTLQNSPSFHLVPRSCTNVTIDHVSFKAPADAPNTDALDPSGWHYSITRCTFDVGDDCIAIKASGKPKGNVLSCEDFSVADCTFRHGHGLSVGGQTPGGLRHLIVRHCTFDSTDAGIRLKAARGSGGLVEDLQYDDLTMKNVKVPVFITSYYPRPPADVDSDPAQPVTAKTPIWKNIRISHLKSVDSPEAGRIIGLPEMPVQDVRFDDVQIAADKGMTIDFAKDVSFENSSITASSGPPLMLHGAQVSGLNSGEK